MGSPHRSYVPATGSPPPPCTFSTVRPVALDLDAPLLTANPPTDSAITTPDPRARRPHGRQVPRAFEQPASGEPHRRRWGRQRSPAFFAHTTRRRRRRFR